MPISFKSLGLFFAIVVAFGGNIVIAPAFCQYYYPKEKIRSEVTIKNEKSVARKNRLIAQAESLNTIPVPGNEDDQSNLDAALWATGQFLVHTPNSDAGVRRLMDAFDQLPQGTQRSLLEVVYGLYPETYERDMSRILNKATHPKIISAAAAYLFRLNPGEQTARMGRQAIAKSPDTKAKAFADAFEYWTRQRMQPIQLPDMDSLLAWQRMHGFKVVYSFQRQNRDYTGLAVVQDTDGKLMRDSSGRLLSFVQLARSASNLPFFITNGSTPQGLYTITGTDISKNVFIGPTPNLQMSMMGEVNPPVFTHYQPLVLNATPWRIYQSYFPQLWHGWSGLAEAFMAGQIGRSEIIAHGTTIDPEWFAGRSYYPISPTLGCLCGREWWNPETGYISQSDQLDLVNAFIGTPGKYGYLMVIDLDDAKSPVSPEALELLLKNW